MIRPNFHMALGLLSFSLFASVGQAAACEPSKVAEKYPSYAGKVVKIAASPTQPPYAFADPANPERMTGLEVELVEKAMKCAGLKYEFNRGTWVGALSSVFTGASDVMVGNVNYRPDRAEKADFILYTRAGSLAVVQKGNPKNIVDLNSACGKIGAAISGGSSALIIERQNKACVEAGKPPIDFKPAADPDAAYRQVFNGRVDFAMDDFVVYSARVASDNDVQVGFSVIGTNIGGFVVQKGNKEMLAAVADGMKFLERSGELASTMKKYGVATDLLVPVEARY